MTCKSAVQASVFLLLLGGANFAASPDARAASAREIDVKVDAALERFRNEVGGGRRFLESAEGVLVFPSVIKAGIGIGGEYGEGALRINGKTVDYYSTAAASIGLQLGAQSKTVVIVFLERKALNNFRNSSGWQANQVSYCNISYTRVRILTHPGRGGSGDVYTLREGLERPRTRPREEHDMGRAVEPRIRTRCAVVVTVTAILGIAGVPPSTAGGPPIDVDTTAHRGAAAMAPENTHAGFDFARHTRAEFIEIDVQLSADGVPVLIHDATLARTTNAMEVFPDRESYRVGEFTWAELQQLDAGSWYHPDFAGEVIPRLEEVIVHARSGAGINIELKDPADSPGVEQVVAEVLAADHRWHALNRRSGLVVSSFDVDALAVFHALRPDVPVSGIGLVPGNDATLMAYALWMDSWATNYRTVDSADIARVQAAGLELIVYTVNSVDHMRQMIDLGVDGIVTDAPQVLQRVKFGFDPLPDAMGLVVEHVLANAPGSDITFDAGEHVVLHNTTDRPVDVDGWFLLDAVANRLDLGPGYVIPPGGTLQVYTGNGNNTENRYFNDFGRNVLNNNGDSIAVFTPDRRLVELHAYYPCSVGEPCPTSPR